MANITNTKVIIAAIDNVEILNVYTTTEQTSGTKINDFFRPTGRNEITTVVAEAGGRFGKIEFSVTKTVFVKYRHDTKGNVTAEFETGDSYGVDAGGKLCLAQALALVKQSGFKF